MWLCDDNDVVWAVRPFLQHLFQNRKKATAWNKVINQEAVNWETFGVCLQLLDPVWFPSVRQFRSNHDPDEALPVKVRDEHSVTTTGVLLVFLSWALFRRRKQEKNHSSHALVSWLSTCVAKEEADPDQIRRSIHHWASLAGCGGVQDGQPCMHVAQVVAHLGGGELFHDMAKLLESLGKSAFGCAQASAVLREMILSITAHVHSRRDQLPLDYDALKHATLENQERQRRGLDYHNALRREIVGKHRAGGRTGTAAGDQVHRHVVQKYDRELMHAIQQAGWRTYSLCGTGVFHFKEDGARLGQPAKEFEHSVLCFPGSELATFLPGQDCVIEFTPTYT